MCYPDSNVVHCLGLTQNSRDLSFLGLIFGSGIVSSQGYVAKGPEVVTGGHSVKQVIGESKSLNES